MCSSQQRQRLQTSNRNEWNSDEWINVIYRLLSFDRFCFFILNDGSAQMGVSCHLQEWLASYCRAATETTFALKINISETVVAKRRRNHPKMELFYQKTKNARNGDANEREREKKIAQQLCRLFVRKQTMRTSIPIRSSHSLFAHSVMPPASIHSILTRFHISLSHTQNRWNVGKIHPKKEREPSGKWNRTTTKKICLIAKCGLI